MNEVSIFKEESKMSGVAKMFINHPIHIDTDCLRSFKKPNSCYFWGGQKERLTFSLSHLSYNYTVIYNH